VSKCLKCGKELVCDIPFDCKMSDGKVVHGFRSASHGCPPEYDHSQFQSSEIGLSKKDIDGIFDAAKEGLTMLITDHNPKSGKGE